MQERDGQIKRYGAGENVESEEARSVRTRLSSKQVGTPPQSQAMSDDEVRLFCERTQQMAKEVADMPMVGASGSSAAAAVASQVGSCV